MCAVNRDCKIPPVRKYNAALSPDTVSYVGIAQDEPKRLARLDGVKKVSLLAKYGMTEADAYKLCQEMCIRDRNYITNSNAGEGLIFYGSTIVPFKDDFPKDTQLYRIMTTRLEETVQN